MNLGIVELSCNGGEIAGRIVHEDGSPIALLPILAESESGEFSTTTDAQGFFAFEDVPEGAYDLSPDVLYVARTSDAQIAACRTGDLDLEIAWKIVRLQVSVCDEEGVPLGGIPVGARLEQDRASEETSKEVWTHTAQDGSPCSIVVEAGSGYSVSALRDGTDVRSTYAFVASGTRDVPVTIVFGEKEDGEVRLTMRLPWGEILAARAGGRLQPVQAVTGGSTHIECSPQESVPVIEGQYQFLPQGSWTEPEWLSVAPEPIELNVYPGKTTDVSIQLVRGGRLAVSVREEENTDSRAKWLVFVRSIMVPRLLELSWLPAAGGSTRQICAQDGQCLSKEILPPGPYEVWLARGNSSGNRVSFNIVAGVVTELALLPPSGRSSE